MYATSAESQRPEESTGGPWAAIQSTTRKRRGATSKLDNPVGDAGLVLLQIQCKGKGDKTFRNVVASKGNQSTTSVKTVYLIGYA